MNLNDPKLRRLHEDITQHMEDICRLFVRPDDVKITVVVRMPWLDDGDVVLTNDIAEDIIATVNMALLDDEEAG